MSISSIADNDHPSLIERVRDSDIAFGASTLIASIFLLTIAACLGTADR